MRTSLNSVEEMKGLTTLTHIQTKITSNHV